ncbi:putative ribonuclease H-like domain-containing protein [Tanacetum coccineum]
MRCKRCFFKFKLQSWKLVDLLKIDVKSAFLYGTIEEEVYVCQPLGFEDPCALMKVYEGREKCFYGLHTKLLEPDETVYKEWEDRMERAATTASSFEAEQDSVNTLRSGEDSMKLMELMEHCTTLSELFWATKKVKTVNGERQLQALVDKKKVIIIETSIRSDLKLEDAGGTDCLSTATIFEELARMGKSLPI